MDPRYQADVVVIGGGLAGMVTALELLEAGKSVCVLERDHADRLGGLARKSFGGVFMVDTPHQRRMKIKDSTELAYEDWCRFAEFEDADGLPRAWARRYVERSCPDVYEWLGRQGVSFFPVVHWVERGMFQPGNSVPRFHMVWGTGHGLVAAIKERIDHHSRVGALRILCEHHVMELTREGGKVVGCEGKAAGKAFSARAEAVVVAAGGIMGDLSLARKYWYKPWGAPPETLLNGAGPYSDGTLHFASERVGAKLTHLDKHWNYAAGVHHPKPEMQDHGLSLVPPKSALWMDYRGRRIGPVPLITAYDTRFLVEQICRQPKKYSWQILNWKIAVRELAVSGADHNEAIKNKQFIRFVMTALFGNKKLARYFVDNCIDFVTAGTVEELARKMNELNGDQSVDAAGLRSDIEHYDAMIERGPAYHNDDQLRRIAHARQYKGDRVRTCKFQKILDPKALPLIAIREFILTRKSMGGIRTDLDCRVLDGRDQPIPGLYAVGEAAGFGGGGVHGLRALEGTFLGSCVFNGRRAARAIAKGSAE